MKLLVKLLLLLWMTALPLSVVAGESSGTDSTATKVTDGNVNNPDATEEAEPECE
ncbi:MAG: hypothetical protein OEY29_11310 [Gammaproteobacteria bacterium]|nr:hypothetical protein [Gammaproteobacteria bacterium]